MRQRRWLVVAVAATGTFVGALDLSIVPVAFADIQRSFPDTRLTDLSWVTTGYATTFGAALLPAGALADRLGRARTFLAGLALFTVASAVCALAPNAGVLVVGRLAQGIGGGTITPLALALILPAFGPARGTAIGLWSATGATAATVGPALGGLLVGVWNWRLVFLVTVPLGAWALLAGRRLPAAGDPEVRSTSVDLTSAALLAAGVGLGSLAVTKSVDWGWAAVWPLAASLLLVTAFGRRSARHPAPLVRLSLVAARPVLVANTALVLFGLAYFSVQLANALFLTGPWALSAGAAGLALTPGAVVTTVASYLAGPAGARFGNRAVAAIGVLLFAIGCLCLALGTSAAPNVWTGFLPGLVLAGIGGGAAFTALAGAAVAAVAADELGVASGLSVTSRAVGGALGFAGLAALLGADPASSAGGVGSYHVAWIAAAVVCLATAGVAMTLRREVGPLVTAP